MSRTTILSEVIQNAMVEAIEAGNYASTAAESVGIGRSTHYEWMSKGEEGIEPYAGYTDAIKKAEANAQMQALSVVKNAMADNWQAAAWYLERKFPELFGRRDKLTQEISTKNNEPLTVDSKTLVLTMLGRIPEEFEEAEIVEEGNDGSERV
jgi:hypothetical protein